MSDRTRNTPEMSQSAASRRVAKVGLDSLDNLWFQVGGTLCNLACEHCFISCSPQNDKFKMMSLAQIQPYLDEAVVLGVKEFYFTGGEPFLNDEIFDILEATLAIGPATVLTNGTIITNRRARELARLEANSIYSLEIRVSLDGFDEPSNDRLRGKGSFKLALNGITRLVEQGMLPILTAVQTWSEAEHERMLAGFKQLLADIGYTRPRFKIIPALDLGAYQQNKIGPAVTEYVTEEMLEDFDRSQLICSNSRMVTNSGVHVCPILIDYPDSRMGESLKATTGEYRLRHPACYTCYLSGAICSNFSSGGQSER
ncbi:radical SAM protein [candidate division GN15 bacterium]|nr:radical SAM protein [candidate division GN15 bacterium]